MSDTKILNLLREAVDAKQSFNDAMAELERALVTPHTVFTENQRAVAHEVVNRFTHIAAGATLSHNDLNSFMFEVSAASTTERKTGFSPALAAPYSPQRPATTLSYEQFVMTYEAHMRQGGTSIQLGHVDSSWHAYQKDPAGHFISRTKPAPKFTVGQMVYVSIDDGGQLFEWSGKVLSTTDVGEPGETQYEYLVEGCPVLPATGFPLLAWESQLKPVFAPDGTMLNRDGNRSIFDDVDK